jgi:hypothetical protein
VDEDQIKFSIKNYIKIKSFKILEKILLQNETRYVNDNSFISDNEIDDYDLDIDSIKTNETFFNDNDLSFIQFSIVN